jgi:hypothetical protein
MYMKKNLLGDIPEMGVKVEVIEPKRFRSIGSAVGEKQGTPLYAGKSHYVDENKWCKNVRFGSCRYVDENTDT